MDELLSEKRSEQRNKGGKEREKKPFKSEGGGRGDGGKKRARNSRRGEREDAHQQVVLKQPFAEKKPQLTRMIAVGGGSSNTNAGGKGSSILSRIGSAEPSGTMVIISNLNANITSEEVSELGLTIGESFYLFYLTLLLYLPLCPRLVKNRRSEISFNYF